MSEKYPELTREELKVSDEIVDYVPASAETNARVESILSKARKNRAISLRIAEHDLEMLKEKAAMEGMPYQTLINTVLHKYVTNQLLDRNEAQKTMQFLQQNNGGESSDYS